MYEIFNNSCFPFFPYSVALDFPFFPYCFRFSILFFLSFFILLLVSASEGPTNPDTLRVACIFKVGIKKFVHLGRDEYF